jgi:outer membrane autotransporter protein
MDFGGGAFTFGMYLGATYARADLDGYTERDVNNTGLAMTFSGTDRESMQGHAGLRMAYTFSTGNGVVVPQLRVEYQHEFEDRGDAVTTNFVLDPDASGFELGGALRDDSAIEAGLGITAMFANGWQTFLNVDVLTGSEDLDRSRVTLGVRVEL